MRPVIELEYNEEPPRIPTREEVRTFPDDFFGTPAWYNKEFGIGKSPLACDSSEYYYKTYTYAGITSMSIYNVFVYLPKEKVAKISGKGVSFYCDSLETFDNLINILNHERL
jgi:hypothetical protein